MQDPVDRFVFGLTAQGRPELETQLAELLAWVSSSAGVVLAPEPSPSYDVLAEKMSDGALDVAWLPPVVFVRLERKKLVAPLVTNLRAGRSTYQSVLVVAKDSPIRALEGLRGARAAWVDPLSAAGYVLPRNQLNAQGFAPDALFAVERFHGTHAAALDAVRKGEADVAGTHGTADADGNLLQGTADPALRVLATFGGIPADVIAARAAIPEQVRARIARAFVAAGEDDAMRAIALRVFGAEGFLLGSEASYAGLHRSLPAALASGLLQAIDADGGAEP